MRNVLPSCVVIFLGIFLLAVIGHHDANATPALDIQQRHEESMTEGLKVELKGVGAPCHWSDECNQTLCCLNYGNGTQSCQKRPTAQGEECYPEKIMLTPWEDEVPYSGACPCGEGFYCDTASNGDSRREQNAKARSEESVKLGHCKVNGTAQEAR
uniref:Ixodegrin B n=1 Tax=Rhipicephalus zambeziensis TaxID=60191 RepID=A0A224YB19_9ACAR